jgi:GGDEF domain-containing protein
MDTTMPAIRQLDSAGLERREFQLTLFACAAISVMGIGIALFMYPVVFAHQDANADRNLRIAFFGFCLLCLLLTAYVWDTQSTIRRLRRQMELDRKQSEAARLQASEELLKSIPKVGAFQDQLPMEYRRATSAEQQLSILVVAFQFPADALSTAGKASILGDVAKAISRKLREQDSLYVLGPACFGVILPGLEASAARALASRIGEGLLDAAGLSARFSYKIEVVNYPQDAESAHELYEAVFAHIPRDKSKQGLAAEAFV